MACAPGSDEDDDADDEDADKEGSGPRRVAARKGKVPGPAPKSTLQDKGNPPSFSKVSYLLHWLLDWIDKSVRMSVRMLWDEALDG